jgi:glycerate-2-kinase
VDYLDGVHGAYYDSQMNQTIERNQDLIQSNISELNSYKIHKELQTLLEGPKTGTNMSDFFLFTFEKKAKSKK